MATFCRDPIFNVNVTWNTTNPNLTSCMRDVVLTSIPLGILTLVGFTILILKKANNNGISFSKLYKSKMTLLLILLANGVGELYMRMTSLNPMYPADIFGPSCLMFGYVLAGVILTLESKRNFHTSPALFYYWLALAVLMVPTFKVQIEGLEVEVKVGQLILVVTFLPFICVQFVLR